MLVCRGTDSLYDYEDGRLEKVIHQFGYTQYNYGFFPIPNKLNVFVEKPGIDMFLPIFGKAIKDMPEHQTCKLANGFTPFDEWMTDFSDLPSYPVSPVT